MNRVELGFFSLSGHAVRGDDRPYLRWHQLDHMPEQYQLPGLVFGQRWAATPADRAARAAAADRWSEVEHVVLYLMGEPLDVTLDEFLTLGRKLAEMGRYSERLPSRYRGGLRLLETWASPAALVSPEVVPFRPNRGIYLIVEEATDRGRYDDHLRRVHAEVLPGLVSVPGVAGIWVFATSSAIRKPNFDDGDYRITVCYLDDEPAAVAERLRGPLARAWAEAPVRPLLAAPYESVSVWDLDRFVPTPAAEGAV